MYISFSRRHSNGVKKLENLMGIELIDDEEDVDVVIISVGVDVAKNENKEDVDST